MHNLKGYATRRLLLLPIGIVTALLCAAGTLDNINMLTNKKDCVAVSSIVLHIYSMKQVKCLDRPTRAGENEIVLLSL